MTRVFNTKTNEWWSWTFSAKWAAEEAIKRGHPHNTDHLKAVDEYEEEVYRDRTRWGAVAHTSLLPYRKGHIF